MVVWTYSGVRPLYDDGSTAAQDATRDYVLKLDAPTGAAPLLSVFGGKITTYRRLAESALAKLAPHLPTVTGLPAGWTGRRDSLPGGDFPVDGFERSSPKRARATRSCRRPRLRRLLRAYGTRILRLLGGRRRARSRPGVRRRSDRGRTALSGARTNGRAPPRMSSGGAASSACAFRPAEIAAIDTVLLAGIPSRV